MADGALFRTGLRHERLEILLSLLGAGSVCDKQPPLAYRRFGSAEIQSTLFLAPRTLRILFFGGKSELVSSKNSYVKSNAKDRAQYIESSMSIKACLLPLPDLCPRIYLTVPLPPAAAPGRCPTRLPPVSPLPQQ